jgi:alkyl hydroperoxide reductase subunit D
MNFLMRPGVPKRDFELWCLVASAVNGCGTCMDAHERATREAGLAPQAVQAAVRAAAVVAGLAVALVSSS